MTERSGIEIDYCPTCRGVWLDRGELDKIIERSVPDTAQPPRREERNDERRDERGDRDQRPLDRDDDWDDDDRGSGRFRKKRKRESMFGDLFDF